MPILHKEFQTKSVAKNPGPNQLQAVVLKERNNDTEFKHVHRAITVVQRAITVLEQCVFLFDHCFFRNCESIIVIRIDYLMKHL